MESPLLKPIVFSEFAKDLSSFTNSVRQTEIWRSGDQKDYGCIYFEVQNQQHYLNFKSLRSTSNKELTNIVGAVIRPRVEKFKKIGDEGQEIYELDANTVGGLGDNSSPAFLNVGQFIDLSETESLWLSIPPEQRATLLEKELDKKFRLYLFDPNSRKQYNDVLNVVKNPIKKLDWSEWEHKGSGIQTPHNQIGPIGTTSPMHIEDNNLLSINVASSRCQKLWILIHVQDHPKFMRKLKAALKAKSDCEVLLKRYYVPTTLMNWEIRFAKILQISNQSIVTLPGQLHQIINLDMSINSSVNFATTDQNDVAIITSFEECLCNPIRKYKYPTPHHSYYDFINLNLPEILRTWPSSGESVDVVEEYSNPPSVPKSSNILKYVCLGCGEDFAKSSNVTRHQVETVDWKRASKNLRHCPYQTRLKSGDRQFFKCMYCDDVTLHSLDELNIHVFESNHRELLAKFKSNCE